MLNDIDNYFPESMARKTYWRNPDACFYENIPLRREGLKNIKEKRIAAMIAVLKDIKCTTPSELASKLGWYHMENGEKKPSKADANRYLKILLSMNLVSKDDERDRRNNKGYVYHWIGE